MKYNMILALIMTIGIVITGCKQTEQTVDLINEEFPASQTEISQIMDTIWQCIADKDIDKLISYHAYGPKFTEFQNGEKRTGSKENEEFERSFFPMFTGIKKWETNDLKIDVFGDVALATFHSDFQPIIGSDTLKVAAQMALLFVNTEDGWKITHEHSSPLNEKGELTQ
jgi:ketosteroid isomerase-like protein